MVSFAIMLVAFILIGGILGRMYVDHDGHLWRDMRTMYKVFLCGYALILLLVLANGMFVDFLILLGAGAISFWMGMRMTRNSLQGRADEYSHEEDDETAADADDEGMTMPVSVAERYEARKTVLDNDEPDRRDGETA